MIILGYFPFTPDQAAHIAIVASGLAGICLGIIVGMKIK